MKTRDTATFLGLAFTVFTGLALGGCSDGKTPAGTGGAAGTGSGGMGGSGGAAGTGGAGATGSNERCGPGPTVATGTKPLIDDFNDSDLDIYADEEGDGRAGKFYAAAAGGGMVVVEPGATELHYTAKAAGDWPSFGIPVANCYDATAYAGIKFKIKGTVKNAGADVPNAVVFSLATPETTPEPAGICPCPDTGVCAECYAGFRSTIPTLTAEYQELSFLWGQLRQPMWGRQAPQGYEFWKYIMEISWGAGVNTAEFDIYLDDVAFIPK